MATGTGRIPFGKNEVFHTATVDRLIIDGDGEIVSTGQIVINSSEAAADAIRINASNAAGGIDVDAGTGGIAIDTTGPLSLDSTSTTAASNFTTVGAAGVDLSIGSTAGSLNLTGGEAAANAVRINASNAAGGIDVDAGTGGVAIDTTGGLSLDSTSTTVASNITTVGAAGVDLTVNSTAGSLILDGGEAAADAVRINASNAAGGIDIDAGTAGITIDTTTGAITILTGNTTAAAIAMACSAGGLQLTANGAAGGVGDINLTSAFSSLVLGAGEAVADAIAFFATAGGIQLNAGTDILLNPGTTGTIQIGEATATGGNLTTPSVTSSSGPAAVPVTGMIHAVTTTGAGDALTLADGTQGQRLLVVYVAEGAAGDSAVLTPTTLAGASTTITFTDLGDSADLVFITGTGWYFLGGAAVVA